MGQPSVGMREARVSLLIGTGHFLSHFYALCLPPLFIAWQHSFHASFAMLGLAVALVSVVAAILQTPTGFLVDRYGARRFLVGGAGLMALSIAAMAGASAYWQVLVFAACAGLGNSVIHPCDYAILSSAIGRGHTGKAFSLHTFAGNAGYASGPPVTIGLASILGWRGALLTLGLCGLVIVAAILWQSKILTDHATDRSAPSEPKLSGKALLLTPTMLLFFGFYVLNSMATSGIQAWLITVLHKIHGLDLQLASWLLTTYFIGVSLGVLVGGWLSDRTSHYLLLLTALTLPTAVLIAMLVLLPLAAGPALLCCFFAGVCYGMTRTPRDMMVRRASPQGQVGTVFGFVSSGLPLGAALAPVPLGFLVGLGFSSLVLLIVAAIMGVSVLIATAAEGSARRKRLLVPAAAAE